MRATASNPTVERTIANAGSALSRAEPRGCAATHTTHRIASTASSHGGPIVLGGAKESASAANASAIAVGTSAVILC